MKSERELESVGTKTIPRLENKESGLFIEIPNTIKLQNIEVTRIWKA